MPTLAGVWTLDVEKSDNAREKMGATARPGGRGPGRGGPGGGFGGGFGGGLGGGGMRGRPPGGPPEGPGEGEPREGQRGPEMRLIMRPPASMLIEQTDTTVVLFEQGLPIEVLVIGLPQDRAASVEREAPHIHATWSGRRLTALREEERIGRASQQLTLSADGKSLTLVIRRESYDDRPPIEIRREYRRQE